MAARAAALQGEAANSRPNVARAPRTRSSIPRNSTRSTRGSTASSAEEEVRRPIAAVLGRATRARATLDEYEGRGRRRRARSKRSRGAQRERPRRSCGARFARGRRALRKRVAAELAELAMAAAASRWRSSRSTSARTAPTRRVSLLGECRRAGASARAHRLGRRAFARVARADRRLADGATRDGASCSTKSMRASAARPARGRCAPRPARARRQVVCVTHLAQLASWADRHYVLARRERAASPTIVGARNRRRRRTRSRNRAHALGRKARRARLSTPAGALLEGRASVLRIWWIFSTLVPPAPTGMPVVNAIMSPEGTSPACTMRCSVI